MLRNYLLIAYRNLLKSKAFSLLNILGLAIGMAASLMILQYISFEQSYDTFHEAHKDIYRVTKLAFQSEKLVDHSAMTFTATGPDLKYRFPEVNEFTTISPMYGNCVVKSQQGAVHSIQ
jgi:putative ABC transport system permease protein